MLFRVYQIIGILAAGCSLWLGVLIFRQIGDVYSAASDWAVGNHMIAYAFVLLAVLTPILVSWISARLFNGRLSLWMIPALLFVIFMLPSNATWILLGLVGLPVILTTTQRLRLAQVSVCIR